MQSFPGLWSSSMESAQLVGMLYKREREMKGRVIDERERERDRERVRWRSHE